ncbi:glycosyltransferase family 4 protein [Salinicola sp. JS01]|uniref:glycosyltransferase family 4 protein n=1 Tax=Salinicola sp. JS01 TaxID=3050071 RepID=UPI00255BB77D|nr:glycosyltransferase family 4 protein [Salinicola sp. JS01]WIX34576.1 glycosyltransferase family 4 protein [Salinicola sp. JS01]
MKIMHVCETVTGGIATYLNNVAGEQLRHPDVSGVSMVLPAAQREEIALGDAVRIHDFPGESRPQRLRHLATRLSAAVAAERPDVVHVHSTFAGLVCRGLPLSLRGAKLVYQPHGVAFDPHRVGGLKRRAIQWVERALYARSDALVAISEYEQTLLNAAGMGERTLLIKNCVRDTREPRVGVDKEDFYLFIGRFDRQKGFDRLYASWGEAHGELRVVGGSVVDAGTAFAPKANMHLLGWLDNASLDGLIARAKALIVPSRWEGFGLVVLEAYRNATPVICSNRGALPELVRDGETGQVFDFDDFAPSLDAALARFEAGDREAMGRRCRERYEREFSPASMNSALLKLYRSSEHCYV